MLKLSTRLRYGTRAVVELASFYEKGPVFLKDIASRQEISIKYLDRILSSLKAAGIVKTLRGAKGGFILNAPPAQVNLLMIAQALEGPLDLVGCIHSKSFCKRVNKCVTRDVWQELGKAMEVVLKTTTLEDLVVREDAQRQLLEHMYYI